MPKLSVMLSRFGYYLSLTFSLSLSAIFSRFLLFSKSRRQ
jgi:hypothetical protein